MRPSFQVQGVLSIPLGQYAVYFGHPIAGDLYAVLALSQVEFLGAYDLGLPPDRFIDVWSADINISARQSEAYMNKMISPEIKERVINKQVDMRDFVDPVLTFGQMIGFGKQESVDFRYERDKQDYSIWRMTNPFSIPISAGSIAGTISAVAGGEHLVTYEELSPSIYEFTSN